MVAQAVGTPWDDPAWRAEALAWVDQTLVMAGLRRSSDAVVPRLRPWAVTVRVPTTDGPVWFKANAPDGLFEPRLLDVLARVVPERVVVPLAVDASRGWSLTPDASARPLRAMLDERLELRLWEDPLRSYALLQRAVAGSVEELLAIGVPDLRPSAVPERYDRVLADAAAMASLDDSERAALVTARSSLAAWCEELAVSRVPASVDHGDLHDGHLLVTRDGRQVCFDWGDAAVAHPFASLLVTLRVASELHGEPFGSPALRRLRDVYLEPWTAEHDARDLRRAVALALRVGPVGRILSWQRLFPGIADAVRRDHAAQVTAWLRRFLADPPL